MQGERKGMLSCMRGIEKAVGHWEGKVFKKPSI
jgi:hypothetical protein